MPLLPFPHFADSRPKKDTPLFEQGTNKAWQWAKRNRFIRWFSDGERRYAQQLWQLALSLPQSE
jgi:hypothetical protein